MEQNVNIEALAQDPAFIKTLVSCATAEDAQQLFATKEISLSAEALLETSLALLKIGEESGVLSEDDLLQIAAGVGGQNSDYSTKLLKSIAPYKLDAIGKAKTGFYPVHPRK